MLERPGGEASFFVLFGTFSAFSSMCAEINSWAFDFQPGFFSGIYTPSSLRGSDLFIKCFCSINDFGIPCQTLFFLSFFSRFFSLVWFFCFLFVVFIIICIHFYNQKKNKHPRWIQLCRTWRRQRSGASNAGRCRCCACCPPTEWRS